MHRGNDDYEDYDHNPPETPTEKSLVRLHTNVMWYSLVRQSDQVDSDQVDAVRSPSVGI